MEGTWRTWTDVPELKGSRFGALATDLQELEQEKADLDTRIKAVRELMLSTFEPVFRTGPIRVGTKQFRYVSEQPTEKLDRRALVLAGVTEEQLDRGTVHGVRAGYLEMRTVKEREAS